MQLRRMSFFNKSIAVLALLAFFSQGFAGQAANHKHSPIHSVADMQKQESAEVDMAAMHSHHQEHVASAELSLALSPDFDDQCCEQKCDCELANCSLLFLISNAHYSHSNLSFDNYSSLHSEFTSILRPSLFRPPIYI